jgi:hypothetical protein
MGGGEKGRREFIVVEFNAVSKASIRASVGNTKMHRHVPT